MAMAQPVEEKSDGPPSFTQTNQSSMDAPTASERVLRRQVVYMQQDQGGFVPQQGYFIENVPVAQQDSCCRGKSLGYKWSVGVTTGIIHLIVSVICIVLSVVIYVYFDKYYVGYGTSVASVLFFIPAGILGILSKSKNISVIIGYLVMSILSSICAACVVVFEIGAAAFSSSVLCPDTEDSCFYKVVPAVFAMHISLSFTCLFEFLCAVVASTVCCGGLRCCCGEMPN